MRRLLVGASVLAIVATGAMATDQNIIITATVSSFCSIGSTGSGTVSPDATINLGAFAAGGVTATPGSVSLGTVACNKASKARLTSTKGALLGPAAISGSQNYINYNATTTGLAANATVAAIVTTGSAAVTAGSDAAQASAFSATVGVTVTPVAASLVAPGSYSDTLVFAITPDP